MADARALAAAISASGLSWQAFARKKLHHDPSHVARYLQLLTLSPVEQAAVSAGQLSVRKASRLAAARHCSATVRAAIK